MTRETPGESRPPVVDRQRVPEEHVKRPRRMPRIDYAEMRAEADAYFGEGRLGDDDPWERVESGS
jgi:hypothetical protein